MAAIAPAPDGNQWVTGHFSQTLSLGGVSLTSVGGKDVFVAKISPSGAVLWAHAFGGPGDDEAFAIAVDSQGGPVIAGRFERQASFDGVGLVSAGFFDAFALKLSGTDGSVQWARAIGATYNDAAYGVAVDAIGNAVVVGEEYGPLTLGSDTLPSYAGKDLFVAKLAANDGAPLWLRGGGGAFDDAAWAVDVASNGDVLVTGGYMGPASFGGIAFDGGPVANYDIPVLRYSSSGALLEARGYGTPCQEHGRAIRTLPNGVLLAGDHQCRELDFGAGELIPPGTPSLGGSGPFVVSFGPDAGVTWQLALSNAELSWDDKSTAVTTLALSPDGDALVGGIYVGNMDDAPRIALQPAGWAARISDAGVVTWFDAFVSDDPEQVGAISPLVDGGILVAGSFSSVPSLCGTPDVPTAGEHDLFIEALVPGQSVLPAPRVPDAGQSPVPSGACTPVTTFPTRGAVKGNPVFASHLLPMAPPTTFIEAATGDFDHDGHADIAMSNHGCSCNPGYSGVLVLWRGDGDGGFTVATPSLVAPTTIDLDSPLYLRVADFNGDGRDDLFISQIGFDEPPWPGAPAKLLLQTNAGVLEDVSVDALPSDRRLLEHAAGPYMHTSAVGDVNCDGAPDIFAGTAYGVAKVPSRVYLNDGTGSFTVMRDGVVPDGGFLGGAITGSVLCDIDRDGDPDLIASGMEGSTSPWTTLALNDGSGTFTAAAPQSVPGLAAGWIFLNFACIDVDQDGWNDVVYHATYGYQQFQLGVWLNQHDGTFRPAPSNPVVSTNVPLYRFAPVDLNGDGWPDLVTSPTAGSMGSVGPPVLMNDGGTLVYVPGLLPGVDDFTTYVVPLDANEDGRPDLVLIRSQNPSEVLLNGTP